LRKKSRFAQDFRFFGNNPKQRDRGKRELRDPGGQGTKWGQGTHGGNREHRTHGRNGIQGEQEGGQWGTKSNRTQIM